MPVHHFGGVILNTSAAYITRNQSVDLVDSQEKKMQIRLYAGWGGRTAKSLLVSTAQKLSVCWVLKVQAYQLLCPYYAPST